MSHLTVALTGDSLITRPLSTVDDSGLRRLRDIIDAADVAYTNLEFICARPPMVPRPRRTGLPVYSPETILDELSQFGFNLFSLAHNHTMDYRDDGLIGTLRALRERGMVCAGAGETLSRARQPQYLDLADGRVAILAACSTDAEQTLAADPDGIVEGRPGISPLRFSVEYELNAAHFASLRDIDESLGTAAGRRNAEALGIAIDASGGPRARRMNFLNANFNEGERTRVHTHPNDLDIEGMSRWIRDARGQADLVIVALHCHEGAAGQYNSDTIADFAREAAHRFIDAGADIFVGHGPHQLAAVEIYQGRPVFHSLGNLAFMPETVATLPSEFLAVAGLPAGATAVDFHNRREGGGGGFTASRAYWESVVPVCHLDDRSHAAIELWPIELDSTDTPHRRGFPRLAPGQAGEDILRRLANLSKPFGTTIEVASGQAQPVGRVAL